jgi:hypothetical protein
MRRWALLVAVLPVCCVVQNCLDYPQVHFVGFLLTDNKYCNQLLVYLSKQFLRCVFKVHLNLPITEQQRTEIFSVVGSFRLIQVL